MRLSMDTGEIPLPAAQCGCSRAHRPFHPACQTAHASISAERPDSSPVPEHRPSRFDPCSGFVPEPPIRNERLALTSTDLDTDALATDGSLRIRKWPGRQRHFGIIRAPDQITGPHALEPHRPVSKFQFDGPIQPWLEFVNPPPSSVSSGGCASRPHRTPVRRPLSAVPRHWRPWARPEPHPAAPRPRAPSALRDVGEPARRLPTRLVWAGHEPWAKSTRVTCRKRKTSAGLTSRSLRPMHRRLLCDRPAW